MSYQAHLDIVLALERLQISSFKKQGIIRLKIKVFNKEKTGVVDRNPKVTVLISRKNLLLAPATPTTSINPKYHLNHCTSPFKTDLNS